MRWPTRCRRTGHRVTHRVAVIGGGIGGLTAAYRLHELAGEVELVLYESTGSLGGKIRTSDFMGRPVDEAPDAFLTRVPWAIDLCEELGITDRFVSPAIGSAYVLVDAKLRKLPKGLALGVPMRFWPLATSGIVSPFAALRAGLDWVRRDDWPGGDESVGGLIRRRLGDQVAERLVDPLVGSIYAGNTDDLDLHLVTPQFETAARQHRSLISGLRSQHKQAPPSDEPIFYGFRDGMSQLVDVLAKRLRRVDIRTTVTVNTVGLTSDNRLAVRTADGSEHFDAVVIATPAHATTGMLADSSPLAASELAKVEFASVVMVTMGFRRRDVGRVLDGSGMLIPKNEGYLTTAASWASSKWPHWSDDEHVVFRISAGRAGDDRALALDDDALVSALLGEIAPLLEISGELLQWRVSRWPNSFAQYAPGHDRLVTRVEAALRRDLPGVHVTGASYRGVGIPAVIRQGGEAATAVLDHLRGR